MKKFLKIVLFGILTLSLINISGTKINYLNNNNEVEKVKSPRKNAYGDVSTIQDLTDLSFTEWHQSGDLATTSDYLNYLYSYSNTQVKVCDIINYNNINEIKEVYSSFPFRQGDYILVSFGYRQNAATDKIFNFNAYEKNSDSSKTIELFNNNILKFYDLSTFSRAVNSQSSINRFLNALKSSFTLYVPDTPEQAFIQVNDNITNNREELDKNFKHIYIKGLTDTFKLNEKIDISPLLSNQNVNELEISLVYNDLPTTIYNQFTLTYPVLSDNSKKYTLSGMQQKQWGNLSRTFKFKINNRDLDASTLVIDLLNYQHTINALSGKSFVLNTNINLPKDIQGTTNYIDIKPAFAYTNVVQSGFYVSYVYNQDKVLNEYMDVYSTNYYKYVMQINKVINSSNCDLGILLYDDDNSPKVSGTPLYNFTKNGYVEDYQTPPRIITFTNQFNTNNLITMKLNSQGEGSSFIFDAYDWLLSNSEPYQINDYDTAYNIGYSEGMHFSTSSTNWIKSVFNAVDSVLQIEILPNFKLWYIIAIPLLFGCVLFVFKILR